MAEQTPYELLGLNENCSFEDIKHNYRMLAKKFHPDVNKTPGAERHFEAIRAAHDFLMDNHVEPIGVQASKTIEEIVFASKMRKAAKKQKKTKPPPPPPNKTRKVGIREESLVDALKRWSNNV